MFILCQLIQLAQGAVTSLGMTGFHIAHPAHRRPAVGADTITGALYRLAHGQLPSNSRPRCTAARTCAGAVPPMWSRALTEPSSVNTSNTSCSIRSEEHTSELQSRPHLVCRLLLEKKKKQVSTNITLPS